LKAGLTIGRDRADRTARRLTIGGAVAIKFLSGTYFNMVFSSAPINEFETGNA
jgi:hypothetical protein